MIIKENLFEKNYTLIKDFQTKSNLIYSLIIEQDNYGIEIDCFSNGKNYVITHKNISLNKNLVLDILTYIYENAIPCETLEDVIKELLEKRKAVIN